MKGILTWCLAAVLLTLFVSTNVRAAACRLNATEAILNITDDITLNPANNGTVGTVLWSKSYKVPNIRYSCNSGVLSSWHSEYSRKYISSLLEHVYATEIPGIGIRIKWPSTGSGVWMPGNSGNNITCSTECSVVNSTVLIEFVQTGSLNSGESYIPAGEIAKASVIPTTNPGDALRIMTINFGTSIKIITRSCSIYPSTNNVDLGSYNISYFQNSSTTQGEKKEFTITMTCPSSTAVTLTLNSFNTIPFGSGTGVIGVESGEGYARNFAIKIFDKTSTYVSTAVKIDSAYSYTVSPALTKTYQAQIYVPASVDRQNALSAGSIVGAVQYTMIIK